MEFAYVLYILLLYPYFHFSFPLPFVSPSFHRQKTYISFLVRILLLPLKASVHTDLDLERFFSDFPLTISHLQDIPCPWALLSVYLLSSIFFPSSGVEHYNWAICILSFQASCTLILHLTELNSGPECPQITPFVPSKPFYPLCYKDTLGGKLVSISFISQMGRLKAERD